MLVRDALGNNLEEGDFVSLAVGNEIGVGQIKKIDAGLGIQSGQPTQPSIFIDILVQRPIISQIGVAAGVIKAAQPAKSVVEA
jgi:hypothetical protein